MRTLMELNCSHCRWPVAGEGADTLFCAQEITEPGSFCKAHRKLAYAKPPKPPAKPAGRPNWSNT